MKKLILDQWGNAEQLERDEKLLCFERSLAALALIMLNPIKAEAILEGPGNEIDKIQIKIWKLNKGALDNEIGNIFEEWESSKKSYAILRKHIERYTLLTLKIFLQMHYKQTQFFEMCKHALNHSRKRFLDAGISTNPLDLVPRHTLDSKSIDIIDQVPKDFLSWPDDPTEQQDLIEQIGYEQIFNDLPTEPLKTSAVILDNTAVLDELLTYFISFIQNRKYNLSQINKISEQISDKTCFRLLKSIPQTTAMLLLGENKSRVFKTGLLFSKINMQLKLKYGYYRKIINEIFNDPYFTTNITKDCEIRDYGSNKPEPTIVNNDTMTNKTSSVVSPYKYGRVSKNSINFYEDSDED